MSGREGLIAHLQSGATTVCRAWSVRRRDGTVFGFTDHDRDLAFDGAVFRAGSGMSASAVQQTTGLAVDNAEGLGLLSDAGVTEADLLAGRFDAAEVVGWLVNWADPADRMVLFRGTFGEIRRAGGAFRAELRGLSEILNQPQGRVYQRDCGAILGDRACGVDLTDPALRLERPVAALAGERVLRIEAAGAFGARWFERGRLTVIDGAAAGTVGLVKLDLRDGSAREITLWQRIGAGLAAGDRVRLEAGCDKRTGTCRTKFGNILNFRGFPHVPGEDWLAAVPTSRGVNDGGSLNR